MTPSAQDPNALYAPELPQMTDGRISLDDLNQEKGVLIIIDESPNASQGDYLTLYWNGIQTGLLYIDTSSPADFFPWNTIISADLVPDGSYPVYYTRMDAASNIAVSKTVTAIVRRNDTSILPAPSFPEANASNTITGDDLADGSTLVQIPAYTGMAAGDEVFLYWVGYTVTDDVVQNSVYSLAHTVSAQETGDPFNLSVPAPYVSAIDTGYATAWYAVQPARGGAAESSDIGRVEIDTSQSILPAPSFTEGNDGWIDASEAADGTPVAIPVYPGIAVNDVVTVNWQGLRENVPVTETEWSDLHTVQASEIVTGFSVIVPAVYIQPVGSGTGQAWYSVMFAGNGEGISATAVVNIDTGHTQLLPAPVLPEATGDNTIDSTEYADGTPVQVTYPGIAAGDNVTLYWQGYQNDGITPVSGSAWSGVHIVTAADVSARTFTEIIPANVITPVGNGFATASYNVIFAGGSGINSSFSTQVKIMTQATYPFSLNAATGAPWRDNPAAPVVPFNQLTLSGSPGDDVQVSLSADAYFNETGSALWEGKLDSKGLALLNVYKLNAPGLVSISAYVTTSPAISATASMTFVNYIPGQGALTGYAVSTGVASNGLSRASVYIRVNDTAELTYARVSIDTGNATFVGYPLQTANILLYDDGSCSADLQDTVAEEVSLTLSLPEATGSAVQTHTSFVNFPVSADTPVISKQ